MSLDSHTRTFADIHRPVDPTVPSRDFYIQNEMTVQEQALWDATNLSDWEPTLQALIRQVYLQYLPPLIPRRNQSSQQMANITYQFFFSCFDLGHLTTRDPESGKLSTFFSTPMHVAVMNGMGGRNHCRSFDREPDGVLLAYCVHKVRLSHTYNTFP